MNRLHLRSVLFISFFIFSMQAPSLSEAQTPLSLQKENSPLQHGIEQYQQGHYALAAKSLQEYLNKEIAPAEQQAQGVVHPQREKAHYYLTMSQIKLGQPEAIVAAQKRLAKTFNPNYKSHIAFNLGQYFFQLGDYDQCVFYHDKAQIDYLNNNEIADQKFELAYSYFNQKKFIQAKSYFSAIKEIPDHKYYIPSNYYYGLLAYNDQDYAPALKSFKRIDQEPSYREVVPYYEAEIYYFMGDLPMVLKLSEQYLENDSFYYKKEMELLTAQTYFEQKEYRKALDFFESYYNASDKIQKEQLYEMAYSYYQLKDWPMAIKRFQPLSNAEDSLGQTAMYLLGDCYLKTGDKEGARNAFAYCANLDYNLSQKEAATFLYGKLSDDLGHSDIAIQSLDQYLQSYPNGPFTGEAQSLLSHLLVNSRNYERALSILSEKSVKDPSDWSLWQKIAVGYGLQQLQDNHLNQADSLLKLSVQQPINQPYEAVANFWRGEIAYRQGRYQEAIALQKAYLEQASSKGSETIAITKDANPQNAKMLIGYSQMKLGDYSHAGQAFEQARNMGSTNSISEAEALLQEADANFMQKNFEKAKNLYQASISKSKTTNNYAIYQLAIVNGLLENNVEKEKYLNQLMAQGTKSDYYYPALYEWAQLKTSQGQTSEGIKGLEKLSQDAATPEKVRSKALVNLGVTYQLQGEQEKAQAAYEQFLTNYPADSNRNLALEGLRSVYIAKGEPDQFIKFVEEHQLPALGDSTLEATYYDAAILHFNNEVWSKAIKAFHTYLEKFPKGGKYIQSHFYKGLSEEKEENYVAAIQDFDKVLAGGWSEFTDGAASSAARISFQQREYQAAISYYEQLRDGTMDIDLLKIAYEGLMKANYEQKNYREAVAYADTLMTLPDLDSNLINPSLLIKANALHELGEADSALAIYQHLQSSKRASIAAESRYFIAKIHYQKQELEKAEDLASKAIKLSSGQDYWIVKCYLLLGDILTEQKDYFNAKATYNSIVNNTTIKVLQEEARQKLEAVKEKEKEHSKINFD